MAILNLVNHVGRFLRASFLCAFLLFFGLPIYGIFSAAYFGYVVSFVFLVLGLRLLHYCLQSNFQATFNFVFCGRVVGDPGHRPKER